MSVEIPVHGKKDSAVFRPSYAGKSVLIYTMNYAPELTSTGRYAGELGAELAKCGAHVEVIATPPHYPGWRVFAPHKAWRYGVDRLDGATVYRCPLLLRAEMRGIWRVLAPLSFALTSMPVAIWRLFRRRPDTLVCVEPTLFPAPVAALFAKMLGVRTVLHVQDLEIEAAFEVGHIGESRLLRRLALAFERMTLKLFDHVVTISHAMKARLLAKDLPEGKVSIIRNWVNLERIYPVDGPNSYRLELGIPDDVLVVQYAGNIGAKQGLEVLLGAAELLRDEPGLLFLIVGDGPERRALFVRYGNLPNVRFLGLQPEERLCELLNLADLHVIPQLAGAADLVLPSKLGGILASGRPLIVTAAPDQELGVFLGESATMVPPGAPGLLAEAISAQAARTDDPGAARRAELAAQLSSAEVLPRFGRIVFGI